MKLVEVVTPSFTGSVIKDGEYLRCKKGDRLEVSDETWKYMQIYFPGHFKLDETPKIHRITIQSKFIKTIGIVTSVFNRPKYVEQMLESFNETKFPKEIETTFIIINDCSTDKKIDSLIENFSNSKIEVRKFFNKENFGPWGSLRNGFDILYMENTDLIMNVDSDVIFKEDWLEKLLNLHKIIPDTIVSGFNAHSHAIKETKESYYIKKTIGGINMVFRWGKYLDLIRPAFNKRESWDWGVCDLVQGAGLTFGVTNPSVIQHIGKESSLGHHHNPDVAEDFE